MRFLKGFLINLQFFTTIPIPIQLPIDREHLEKAVKTFPLLGLFQGILYFLSLIALMEFTPFSILAITFFFWLLTIVMTGGIHLDGWMDTNDAYFSYKNVQNRQRIMEDPRTGAFGVLSVFILLCAKFFFIYEILKMTATPYIYTIILIPFLSKMLMGLLLTHVQPGKRSGLAYLFRNAIAGSKLSLYFLYCGAVLLLFVQIEDHAFHIVPWFSVIFVLFYLFARSKSVKWFGGITGDSLGASVEGVETLLWMTLWLLHYFVMA